ncbi:MAG: HD domain-containing protein, partial [Lachnospiraceae bacterium]|nr:HD domain-containing protein [Lachnospiraceae bacterium]
MKKKFDFTPKRIRQYVYDQSVNIKDRAFLLFSIMVLCALFIAVPAGLIMHEPLSATISTLVGAIFFTAYVFYTFRWGSIARAKIVLSIIVVFLFLPAMFFTNGGVEGGAPIWLLLGMIYISMILDGAAKYVMLTLNALVLIACWIVGYFFPDIVTQYSRGGNYFDSAAALFIVSGIIYSLITFYLNLYRKEEKNKNLQRLFEQTATALVSAIDAKDKYTHGHSSRVAEYSRKIAELAGKSPEECNEIYYVALLHDVGKIGIPENIINKEGRLSEEEYEIIKQHPVLGGQILNSISEYPKLIIGARYHHERYDGRGYPDKLKGVDMPEIARISSVADAYDAMTSKRSYRDPIPQQSVREEIVKGAGSQFDPTFAKIMQHLIDLDSEYEMKEKGSVQELAGKDELLCGQLRDAISEGILLGPQIKKINLKCETRDKDEGKGRPAIILFDSLDGRTHDTEREIRELNYFEYAGLMFDGESECIGARKIETQESNSKSGRVDSQRIKRTLYEITAVKVKDHVMITIDDMAKVRTVTVALPDSTRYAYIGLTGENCRLYDVSISTEETPVPDDYIPRIAEEVSYIKGPAGD